MKSPFGEGRSRRAAPSLKGALGAQPRRGGQWRVPAGPQLYANAPGAARPPRPAPPRRMPVPPDGRGGPSTPLRRLARPAEGGVRGSDGPRRPPPPRSPPFVPGVAQLYANNEHKGARGGGGRLARVPPACPAPPTKGPAGAGRALPARAPGPAAAPRSPLLPPARQLCEPSARLPAPSRTKGCGSGAAARALPAAAAPAASSGAAGAFCVGTDCGVRECEEQGPSARPPQHLVPDARRFGLKPSPTVNVPACSGNRARLVRGRVRVNRFDYHRAGSMAPPVPTPQQRGVVWFAGLPGSAGPR